MAERHCCPRDRFAAICRDDKAPHQPALRPGSKYPIAECPSRCGPSCGQLCLTFAAWQGEFGRNMAANGGGILVLVWAFLRCRGPLHELTPARRHAWWCFEPAVGTAIADHLQATARRDVALREASATGATEASRSRYALRQGIRQGGAASPPHVIQPYGNYGTGAYSDRTRPAETGAGKPRGTPDPVRLCQKGAAATRRKTARTSGGLCGPPRDKGRWRRRWATGQTISGSGNAARQHRYLPRNPFGGRQRSAAGCPGRRCTSRDGRCGIAP